MHTGHTPCATAGHAAPDETERAFCDAFQHADLTPRFLATNIYQLAKSSGNMTPHHTSPPPNSSTAVAEKASAMQQQVRKIHWVICIPPCYLRGLRESTIV